MRHLAAETSALWFATPRWSKTQVVAAIAFMKRYRQLHNPALRPYKPLAVRYRFSL